MTFGSETERTNGIQGGAPFQITFACDLPHGRCVGVTLPDLSTSETPTDDAMVRLPPEEQAIATQLGPHRRAAFVGGRLALHAALADLGVVTPTVLGQTVLGKDERGAPVLPAGVTGSISHKSDLAVALAAPSHDGTACVGIDLEDIPLGRPTDISKRILTPAEQTAIATLAEDARQQQIRAAFAIKEAVYKAISRDFRRAIGFAEVHLGLPIPLGSAGAWVAAHTLPQPETPPALTLTAWVAVLSGRLVATAHAQRDARQKP